MYADLYRLGRRIGGLLIPVSSDGRLCHAIRSQNRSMAVASRLMLLSACVTQKSRSCLVWSLFSVDLLLKPELWIKPRLRSANMMFSLFFFFPSFLFVEKGTVFF